MSKPPIGAATPENYGDAYSRLEFMVSQLAGRMATVTICEVMAVYSDMQMVDVKPLVQQMTGGGLAVSHGNIHNVPYVRLQGGVCAVILDPVVGDKGIALFASHDISKVKNTRAEALPGSRRRFDWADALYVGGILNGTPTSYVQFDANGDIHLKPAATVYVAGAIEATGDVMANGISLTQHKHSGVATGGSETGVPVP